MFRKTDKHIIYLITDGIYYKIGRSANYATMARRLRGIRSPNKTKLLFICAISSNANITEDIIHNEFKHLRVIGEWFKLDNSIKDYFFNRWLEDYENRKVCSDNFYIKPSKTFKILMPCFQEGYITRIKKITKLKKLYLDSKSVLF